MTFAEQTFVSEIVPYNLETINLEAMIGFFSLLDLRVCQKNLDCQEI